MYLSVIFLSKEMNALSANYFKYVLTNLRLEVISTYFAKGTAYYILLKKVK